VIFAGGSGYPEGDAADAAQQAINAEGHGDAPRAAARRDARERARARSDGRSRRWSYARRALAAVAVAYAALALEDAIGLSPSPGRSNAAAIGHSARKARQRCPRGHVLLARRGPRVITAQQPEAYVVLARACAQSLRRIRISVRGPQRISWLVRRLPAGAPAHRTVKLTFPSLVNANAPHSVIVTIEARSRRGKLLGRLHVKLTYTEGAPLQQLPAGGATFGWGAAARPIPPPPSGPKFIASIDTMKLSKDLAAYGFTTADTQAIDLAAATNATHITDNAPLEYPAVEEAYANRIHADGEHVWFRLNAFGVNIAHGDLGDGYPTFAPGYLTRLHEVMLAHPGMFKAGDILDGDAEAENSVWWANQYGCGVQGLCTPCNAEQAVRARGAVQPLPRRDDRTGEPRPRFAGDRGRRYDRPLDGPWHRPTPTLRLDGAGDGGTKSPSMPTPIRAQPIRAPRLAPGAAR